MPIETNIPAYASANTLFINTDTEFGTMTLIPGTIDLQVGKLSVSNVIISNARAKLCLFKLPKSMEVISGRVNLEFKPINFGKHTAPFTGIYTIDERSEFNFTSKTGFNATINYQGHDYTINTSARTINKNLLDQLIHLSSALVIDSNLLFH